STLPLAHIAAEMTRLEALFSADKIVRDQYAALTGRIAQENSALQTLETRLADAQGAAARRKDLQTERDDTCGRVFEAIINEQNALAGLYAPLMARLAASSGTRTKLSFSVRRISDVQTWGSLAEEELLDRRRSNLKNCGRCNLVPNQAASALNVVQLSNQLNRALSRSCSVVNAGIPRLKGTECQLVREEETRQRATSGHQNPSELDPWRKWGRPNLCIASVSAVDHRVRNQHGKKVPLSTVARWPPINLPLVRSLTGYRKFRATRGRLTSCRRTCVLRSRIRWLHGSGMQTRITARRQRCPVLCWRDE